MGKIFEHLGGDEDSVAVYGRGSPTGDSDGGRYQISIKSGADWRTAYFSEGVIRALVSALSESLPADATASEPALVDGDDGFMFAPALSNTEARVQFSIHCADGSRREVSWPLGSQPEAEDIATMLNMTMPVIEPDLVWQSTVQSQGLSEGLDTDIRQALYQALGVSSSDETTLDLVRALARTRDNIAECAKDWEKAERSARDARDVLDRRLNATKERLTELVAMNDLLARSGHAKGAAGVRQIIKEARDDARLKVRESEAMMEACLASLRHWSPEILG